MFKCPICNKEFKTKKQLGGHSGTHRKTKVQIAYEQNPKLCLECNKPILYLSYSRGYKSKFCCKSCSAFHYHKINLNNSLK